ncbi:response regulator [Spirosoma linguale]|uniref:Response regulator receiver protein n=1 Tax=Spirosoma linguale (strain ATCC 33905 / DSM 74 / LMG 10896 / Claus 1) TaxID=504472 RepID=D2QI89_SPILD|nr:response regulator receiver protein [Spirosoma linguale DSM 74]
MNPEVSKILFIEDDSALRTNVAELLTIKGYDVLIAANGAEGIYLAKDGIPNLILCDLSMPDMNGQQVMEAIRNIPAAAHIPFLFLTGQSDPSVLHQQMGLKTIDYLAKPFQLTDLLVAINNRLAKGIN